VKLPLGVLEGEDLLEQLAFIIETTWKVGKQLLKECMLKEVR
jgi:hypothetical protein